MKHEAGLAASTAAGGGAAAGAAGGALSKVSDFGRSVCERERCSSRNGDFPAGDCRSRFAVGGVVMTQRCAGRGDLLRKVLGRCCRLVRHYLVYMYIARGKTVGVCTPSQPTSSRAHVQ